MSRSQRARAGATLGLAALIVGVDLATKQLAEARLSDTVELVPGLALELGYNSGVAFGALSDAPRWLLVASVLVLVVFLLTMSAREALPLGRMGGGLLLGGALGNLIDRLPDGRVTDFIDPARWPAFNLADVAITIAVGLLLLSALRAPERPPAGRLRPQR